MDIDPIHQLRNSILEYKEQQANLVNDHKNNTRSLETIDLDEDANINETSLIFTRVKAQDAFVALTNFTELEILHLYHLTQPFQADNGKRGRKPSVSTLDSIIVLLVFYTTYLDYDELSKILNIPKTPLKDCINRIRPIIHKTLCTEWIENRKRPTPINNNTFPYVAISFDHTSINTYRPTGRFEESKKYFDKKNHKYALKKGVGVMSSSPHYALFFSKAVPGSIHDFVDFQDFYKELLPYLLKTPEEKSQLPNDNESDYWGVTMDKGYIGNSEKTAGLRKITPHKDVNLSSQLNHNNQFYLVHPIERFFGRLKKLWKIMSSIYRTDHSNFDLDFENCCLLTNEHIKNAQLSIIQVAFKQH